ncbi:GDYXXLXY domain-containing protein [Bdellovibrio sp. HCB209]|uniref:GDYXXLXY domain-containing protein n=1 Tax=Bdellovibrio sp. HCB209 TaxID=3394354 RepID=UPI0039B4843E
MKKLIAAIAIPCLTLLAMALYHQSLLSTSPEYEFEITGYDPRDLLAGRYLRFTIKYDMDTTCEQDKYIDVKMCVSPFKRMITDGNLDGCKQWINGTCYKSRVNDQLNRFYVPEDKAPVLESAMVGKRATIKVSVGQGNAVIKDLLIEGKSWKDY